MILEFIKITISFLLVFIFSNCNVENECIQITRKESKNNVYLFFWNDNSQNNLGLDASPIPSGAVSKEIYNKYDVGDTYCLEELML